MKERQNQVESGSIFPCSHIHMDHDSIAAFLAHAALLTVIVMRWNFV